MRGRPACARVDALEAAGDVPCTTAVNVEELARGLRGRETQFAQRLVAGLRVVPLGRDEGWQAGLWRRRFASRSVTLSQADALIAAAALSVAATIATGNPRHFPMREVDVEHWPVGA
jgi:predicted nucleic acid-binding protein